MDNRPPADPNNQQNSQPERRLFVYSRPHASNSTAPVAPTTFEPQTFQQPKPAPTSTPQPFRVQNLQPVESVPVKAVAPTPKPQLPEQNWQKPDLADLKPVWQLSIPEEYTEQQQPINRPTKQTKKRLWHKADAPNSEPMPEPQPQATPLAPPAPVVPPVPPVQPAPIPQYDPKPNPAPPNSIPTPHQAPPPEDIALSQPTSPNIVAKIPENNFALSNQFSPNFKTAKKSKLKSLFGIMPKAVPIMAGLVLVAGAVVAFNARQAKELAVNSTASPKKTSQQSEVLASKATAPSEDPLGDNLSLYRVEPGAPSKVVIDSLKLDTRAANVGVDNNNVIEAPDNINKIGWYEGSAEPGKAGVVILNGFIEGPTKRGALYGIDKLKKGDKINIERGDGVDYSYTVQAVESYKNDEIDMSKVSTPYVRGKNGLNIMTVGGRYNSQTSQFELRYAVYAVQDE